MKKWVALWPPQYTLQTGHVLPLRQRFWVGVCWEQEINRPIAKLKLCKTTTSHSEVKESTQQLTSHRLSYREATAPGTLGLSGPASPPLVQLVTLLRTFVVIHEQRLPYCTVMFWGEANKNQNVHHVSMI